MLKIKHEDWEKLIVYGVKLLKDELKEIKNPEIILSGYSTGGPISLNYILKQIKNNAEVPNKVFWFSPAMGVTPLAKFGFLDIALSKIPYFDKFKWLEIEPEYDGGKYNSFTKNAGIEVSKLITENNKLLKKLTSRDKENFPPIYIYQSLVDDTVDGKSIFKVNQTLGNPNGELVIFDVNRKFNDFFTFSVQNSTIEKISTEFPTKSTLTFLSNINSENPEVFQSKNGILKKKTFSIPLLWEPFSVSLAHISLPISPDNYHYGKHTILGNLNMKGEKEILTVSSGDISRLRYNQFFDYLKFSIKNNLRKEKKL